MYVFFEHDNFTIDSQHTELHILYDAAQKTGTSSTGSDSATCQQRMREQFSCEYL